MAFMSAPLLEAVIVPPKTHFAHSPLDVAQSASARFASRKRRLGRDAGVGQPGTNNRRSNKSPGLRSSGDRGLAAWLSSHIARTFFNYLSRSNKNERTYDSWIPRSRVDGVERSWIGAPPTRTPTTKARLSPTTAAPARAEDIGDFVTIFKGFAIAPVKLDLKGKNSALVGLGSYIVNAHGGCNDCHTSPPYAEGGDPFQGEPEQINQAAYLAGGTRVRPVREPQLDAGRARASQRA